MITLPLLPLLLLAGIGIVALPLPLLFALVEPPLPLVMVAVAEAVAVVVGVVAGLVAATAARPLPINCATVTCELVSAADGEFKSSDNRDLQMLGLYYLTRLDGVPRANTASVLLGVRF